MLLQKIIDELEKNEVVLLDEDQLDQILSKTEQIKKQDTLINNLIRILRYSNYLLIQEMTDKKEISVRKIESLQQGLSFIKGRMELYEKMWDGCGCKINYYD